MAQADQLVPINDDRQALADVFQRLAEFGRARAERRAAQKQNNDRAGAQHDDLFLHARIDQS